MTITATRRFFALVVYATSAFALSAFSSEIYINPLVVDTGDSFSFYVTARHSVNLQSYVLRLHLPIETVARVDSIDPTGNEYSSFESDSYYDTNLNGVVWTVSATFANPVSGNPILFKVNASASSKAGYSNIGVAVKSGELLGSFVHGGSIYVLDQNWPWYDVQINYQNAFNRLDFDHSGTVDKKDLFFLSAAWHQTFSTDLPAQPTPTPDPSEPTPTPVPTEAPSVDEFIGVWTFDFLHNTLIGTDIHRVFDAEIDENGAIIPLDRYQTDFLGTFVYEESDGTIVGVFMILASNPLNPIENIEYFVNFNGETGAGNTINGTAQFTYNTNDFSITGYESYGLTVTDTGIFTAVKK